MKHPVAATLLGAALSIAAALLLLWKLAMGVDLERVREERALVDACAALLDAVGLHDPHVVDVEAYCGPLFHSAPPLRTVSMDCSDALVSALSASAGIGTAAPGPSCRCCPLSASARRSSLRSRGGNVAGMRLTIAAVGRLFGRKLPRPQEKGVCPLREHKRKDKTFRVFVSRGGDEVYKCWSCDPPDNVGDAIGLYALLGGMARKDAWKALSEQGYEVPGQVDKGSGRSEGARRPPPPEKKPLPPLRGTRPARVMPLDQEAWTAWGKLDTGLVGRFAKMRGLTPELLRGERVIEMPGGRSIGFTYMDPRSGLACRVKVRGVPDKRFFVVPKSPPDDPARKALAPLYRGHLLRCTAGSLRPVIVTEGEVDALSLVAMGFPNVVSLPDGSESVKTSDLEPLWQLGFTTWLLALDFDAPGELAYKFLRERAAAARVDAIRIVWRRIVGEELVTYKDANDALVAGFSREDFVRCCDVATEARYGAPLAWELG